MKHTDLLLKLATKLQEISPHEYSITDHVKGPLGVAGKMKEFNKLGFALVCNEDGEDSSVHPRGSWRVMYKGTYDCDAAAKFFDISIIEALHLFDQYATNEQGYSQPCPFNKSGASLRNNEPPSWTAGRIQAFLRRDAEEKKIAEQQVTAA